MLVAASAAVTLFSVLSAASPVAATAAVGAAHRKRVCAAKPSGYVACDAHVVTDVNLQPLVTTSYQSGVAPAQMRTAYGLTTDATTVAIIDAYSNPNAAADLASYRSQFGLGGATLTQLNQTGGPISTVSGNTGWGQQEMLDLEIVSAIRKSCAILHVGANSAASTDLAAAVDAAAANGATVISSPSGGNAFCTEASIARQPQVLVSSIPSPSAPHEPPGLMGLANTSGMPRP